MLDFELLSLLNYPRELMAAFLQKKKVGDPVSYKESCERLKQIISGDTHHHTPQPVPDSAVDQPVLDQPVIQPKPVIPSAQQADDAMQGEDQPHFTLSGPVPSGSTTTPKLKKKKVSAKAVEKIYTDFHIPEDRRNNLREIFVYDVPAKWTHEKILAELKSWGLWQYTLENQKVRWFPGHWTLQQRKKREQFHLYVNDLSEDSKFWQLWDRNQPVLVFTNYPIKAVKHFRVSGKSSIVAFFEKFENVEACRQTTFNFNHNDQDYSHPWCKAPSFANSKVFTNKSKSSSIPSKPSKKDKKTVPSKTCPTKSNKPAKDTKKTSKKSKDKKKSKKSSNKKPQDKMDIVKLLLQLLI
ncbi:hypothetical protein RclHR1_03180016 [Rhizophagus clarus]|uniref:Uncharacterized protein n=1 Tax=Rhizophagus clarus TaxID=94130 RepID=A0A2Z6RNV5_9GLOM|nr:hypothetical protein RclHR1_03180016 [Rhizophagus clarus]GES94486.1 hypothetical protein GLOIN_2v1571598 [Rhizophagus clarus]